MGYLTKSLDRQEIQSVFTAAGRVLSSPFGVHAQARIWILADRSVVVCLPEGRRGINRVVYNYVVSSQNNKPLEQVIVDVGETLPIIFSYSGCGCGMGAVGNAGPIAGQYQKVNVRAPEWHTS